MIYLILKSTEKISFKNMVSSYFDLPLYFLFCRTAGMQPTKGLRGPGPSIFQVIIIYLKQGWAPSFFNQVEGLREPGTSNLETTTICLPAKSRKRRLSQISKYRTGANKGRGLHSKKIFWSIGAAYKQERLQFKKNFLKKINLLIHKTCYKSHQKMLDLS